MSKIGILTDLESSEGSLPDSLMSIFSLCPHLIEGMTMFSGVSFPRTLISVVRSPSHVLITSQKLTPYILNIKD
jgi:hypothetical protein